MKHFTFIAAAALAIGLGLGFSKPAEAVANECDNSNMGGCMAECLDSGTPYRVCHNRCCIS